MSSNVEKEPGPLGDAPEQQAPPTTTAPEKKKREYKDFGHDEEKATRTFYLFSSPPSP
jgi:H+-transporting ATPase